MRYMALTGLAVILAWLVGLGPAVPALAGDQTKKDDDAVQQLARATRLACAFVQGMTAGFSPQGRVSLKPPLDPNTPGLSIQIVDREKHRAVLEEDAKETPGVIVTSSMGLSVVARYPEGGVAMVTVYPVYSGASDNFLMVMSQHGASTEPKMNQRYGMCRLGAEPSPTPPPPPPAPKGGHGHK